MMVSSTDQSLLVADETLLLLPERAVYWPRREMLFVADAHWGKTATFRAAGLAIPEGSTSDDLTRLDRALTRTGARHLLLLGDLLHAKAGRSGTLFTTITDWRKRWPDLEITLVRGNHDRGAGDPPPEWGFVCVDEPLVLPPFVLCHHPQESPDGYVLAGHIHPMVRLRGAGRQSAQLPCFWFGPRCAVLPAFGSFTGNAVVSPAPADQVFVVADGEVVNVGHNA